MKAERNNTTGLEPVKENRWFTWYKLPVGLAKLGYTALVLWKEENRLFAEHASERPDYGTHRGNIYFGGISSYTKQLPRTEFVWGRAHGYFVG